MPENKDKNEPFEKSRKSKLKRQDKAIIFILNASMYIILGLFLLMIIVIIDPGVKQPEPTAALPSDFASHIPAQDAQGYYLLENKDDFDWFIKNGSSRSERINARLMSDIVLNDTADWENWTHEPPENTYPCIGYYLGDFVGNGYALIGYFSQNGSPVFGVLEPGATVRNLSLRQCMVVSGVEDLFYEKDGQWQSLCAAALCWSNKGTIDQCSADIFVTSMLESSGLVAQNQNQGIITNCRVSGTVIGGRDWADFNPPDNLKSEEWFAGGICGINNGGTIKHCVNEADVFMKVVHLVNSNGIEAVGAGGICGFNTTSGIILDSENHGRIEATQLTGGIAGANYGLINQCKNRGPVHVEPVDIGYRQYLAAGGIAASNRKLISMCFNDGPVTINPALGSINTPIYAIAYNMDEEARTDNCYYLAASSAQAYRQSGVYKLTAAEAESLDDYLFDKPMAEMNSLELLSAMPDGIGTDPDDYTALRLGPENETAYQVRPGDSLWQIAEKYYGSGEYYHLLIRDKKTHDDESDADADTIISDDNHTDKDDQEPLLPGEIITVPAKQYYLLHSDNEEGNSWYSIGYQEERWPLRFLLTKPLDWYTGSTNADVNLYAIWPKNATGHSRILYHYNDNAEGDFFSDWETVKTNLRRSAAYYCGDQIGKIRFYRYCIDQNDFLYGYTFQIYRDDVTLDCTAYYRLKEGLLVEYIGLAPAGEAPELAKRVRYLAARADGSFIIDATALRWGEQESLLGRDEWAYPALHNPFAICMQYDINENNQPALLWTGVQ